MIHSTGETHIVLLSCVAPCQVISASGAVKHEEVVQQVKTLFNKLSTNADTTCQLVAREPSGYTGSEVLALS